MCYFFLCCKFLTRFLFISTLTLLLLSGHNNPAIGSGDKADALHQLDVTGVQVDLLERQQKSTLIAPVSLSRKSNGNSINNSNITIQSTNTVSGNITSKGGSTVSIGSTTIGSVAEDDKNSGTSFVWSPPIPEQDPSTPSSPSNDVIGQCKDGVEIPSDIDDCWQQCGCFEVDGCSAPVPNKNGIKGYPDIFGAAEICCSEPIDKPCNQHDRCYQSCKTTQLGCDLLLLDLMSKACLDLPITAQVRCHAKAQTYFSTLAPRPFGAGLGIFAFIKRKLEMCIN